MPNPTAGDVHVNRPLTNISIAYMQSAQGFVADRVFPNIPVQKQSDRYFAYDRSDFWRNQFRKRAPGTESAGGGWKVDNTPNYYCDKWALHKDIDDDTRANADMPLNMDRDASEYLAQQALISREVEWASAFFAAGLWTTDLDGVSGTPGSGEVLQWNDSSSTPISDIKTNATVMQALTGYRPNKLILGREVWDQVSEHGDLIDRIKYSGGVGNERPAIITLQAAAALFGIDEVMVMDGIQVTSDENPSFETSITTAFIGGKKALLCYAAPRPSLLMPSAGYTFSWSAFAGAGPQGQRIKRFRIEKEESDRVEAQMAYDQKLIGADLGVFFDTIVA